MTKSNCELVRHEWEMYRRYNTGIRIAKTGRRNTYCRVGQKGHGYTNTGCLKKRPNL